jgi:hypothetical protein
MIAAIKSWLFNRRLQQSLSQSTSNSKSAINKGRQVAILTDDDCDMRAVDRFVTQLQDRGRTVSGLHYTTTKDIEPDPGTLTPKQLNWYGWPQSDTVTQWLSTPYDILIVLAERPSSVTAMLAASVRAELKTGASDFIDHIDLVVDLDEKESTSDLIRKITTIIGYLSAA